MIINELRTTRSERRTDSRYNITGAAVEMLFHYLDGPPDDIVDTAAPTRMNISDYLPDRIIHEDGLTVGHLHRQKLVLDIGHHGITPKPATGIRFIATILSVLNFPK